VARLLHAGIEDPRPCSYLPDVPASLEHRVMVDVLPDEADALLCRGWRHFGPGWFRPACTGCQACLSTRIVVDAFSPSRSQRRAQRLARHLRAEVSKPVIDDARLNLFHAWQRDRAQARGWEMSELSVQDYFMRFAFPSSVAREVAYYDSEADNRLVMVAICDETPQAWSAIFCFYDPAYARISPGIANILRLVDLARATSRPFVYLGYCVLACQSLRYKAAFRPQELLVGLPGDDETPRWDRMATLREAGLVLSQP
jgi:arginyl-tRNA--protein-N-Asp/Glu arginylyltransferase